MRFFAHLDLSTLSVAFRVHFWVTVLAIVCLFGLTVSVLLLHVWKPFRPPLPWVIGPIALFGLATSFVPGYSLVQYFKGYLDYDAQLQAVLRSQVQVPEIPSSLGWERPKNLVLIYAEGLEQTYLDESIFGNVMPEIRNLRTEGLRFTDIRQYPGTDWTIAGMVSSQCGLPLISRGTGNQILASLNNPFKNATCLAEALQSAGYTTAFMGGASLAFAGKGKFLLDNGFQLAIGRDQFPDFSQEHAWGIYDSELFREAGKMRDRLISAETPFLLTILTLDTHHPYGHPSPACETSTVRNQDILVAVRCSDRLISQFVRETIDADKKGETVVAVLSDHLAHRNTASELLNRSDRRLQFFISGSNAPPLEIRSAGTHFDVAPTLLDAIGFGGVKLGLGQSLLSNSEGGVFAANLSPTDIENFDLEGIFPSLTPPFRIEANSEELVIGDSVFLTNDGDVRTNNRHESIRFLAIGINSAEDQPVQLFSKPHRFHEAFLSDNSDQMWVVYSSGFSTCYIVSDCGNSPKLILAKSGSGARFVREGEGVLIIEKDDVADFITFREDN